ncbi:MAG: phospholipid/cholesterol/gamma-HCH transport system permease protein [Desulfovibrionales bacterium]|nr:phospholipid/cholesterol/gamma-HCH transport system permease protein [Desulfovibrionales bacterium]
MSNASTIEFSTAQGPAGSLTATFTGVLDADGAGRVWTRAVEAVRAGSGEVSLDVGGLSEIDGVGLGLLVALKAIQAEKGATLAIHGLPSALQTVIDRYDAAKLAELQKPRQQDRAGFVVRAGRFGWEVMRAAKGVISFVGECCIALVYAVLHPWSIRFKDLARQCELVGANGLGIIVLIGFLMGLILAFQTAITLIRFGAQAFVPNMLGLAMVREMGPLVTAILLAGRSGSAFAAEIGTMKVNDEINALVTMGLAPMRFLVTPKILAAMIMTPLLTLFFDLFSFVGGAVVMLSLDYPLESYAHRLFNNVSMTDFIGGLIKALVFSLLVAGVGCLQGLNTRNGAGAVGESTTAAVVGGIVLIAVADGLFAVIYYALGI